MDFEIFGCFTLTINKITYNLMSILVTGQLWCPDGCLGRDQQVLAGERDVWLTVEECRETSHRVVIESVPSLPGLPVRGEVLFDFECVVLHS